MSTLQPELPLHAPKQPAPVSRAGAAARRWPEGSHWPRWTREPLLHFVLLGAVLFAIDHRLNAPTDDPRTIVVGPAVETELRDTFRRARGDNPTPAQLAALRQHWVDNEVLYREGIALRVDQGDNTIRDRVIFKALNIVEAGLQAPSSDDASLRAWFEANRTRYDEPKRIDFQEAVLAGDRSEAAVRGFVRELNTGTGNTRAGLRVFKARPLATLADGYGQAFATALPALPVGEWTALQGKDGWRAVRLDALVAPLPAQFEVLRGTVQQDWIDAQMAEQRTQAVRQLATKYRIVTAGNP